MKKRLVSIILAGALLLTALLALASCGNSKGGGNRLSSESIYDFSVLGGIGLLEADSRAAEVAQSLASQPIPSSALTEEQKEKILGNLAIVSNLAGGDIVKSEVSTSDREGYAHKYTISAADITGENKIYTFYYNERTIEIERDETESLLEGIVILDGVEYSIRGEHSIEGNEEEYEITVKLDSNNYVVIEQETARGEREFGYTKYENGREVFESSVEYEVDRFGRVEMSFESEMNGSEVEYTYKFFEADGTSYVRVENENNNVEISVLVRITEGENGAQVYEFVDQIGESATPVNLNSF